MRKIPWLLPSLLPGLLLLAGGCSSFDGAYEKAMKEPIPAGSVEGPWQGTWKSENGHGGDRLRAIVSKTGPQKYHIWFRAKFWAIFEASQEVDFTAANDSTPVKASGDEDLGSLAGGIYHYDALITPAALDATYQSKYDHGEFHLKREPTP